MKIEDKMFMKKIYWNKLGAREWQCERKGNIERRIAESESLCRWRK
jgi:hypothetical protein